MDDEEDDYAPGIAWGDLSAIFVAGCFSLFCIGLIVYMVLGGHPLAVLFRPPPEQAQPAVPSDEEQRAAPFHTQPGEVVITTKTTTPAARSGPRKPTPPPHG